MIRSSSVGWLVVAGFVTACGNTQLVPKSQKQAECGDDGGGHLNSIGQCVQCVADADCPIGQSCNLISGSCVPTVVNVYDGGPPPLCDPGANRCSPDGTGIQTCEAGDGGNGWVTTTQCGQGQTCNPQTLTCAICVPGSTSCNGQDGTPNLTVCSRDGTTWNPAPCGDGFYCVTKTPADAGGAGLAICQLCTPNSSSCGVAPDGGIGTVSCDQTGNVLSFNSCWPTNACISDAGAGQPFNPRCIQPTCVPSYGGDDGGVVPAQAQCVYSDGGLSTLGDTQGRQVCNSNGTGWVESDCTATGTVCAPDTTGAYECLSACQIAEDSNSYFGCDYWAAVLSNAELQSSYTGNGTNVSDFALVVSNTGTTPANAQVTDANGTLYGSATIQPGSNQAIQLPWREICGTGVANFGYHLTTDVPVTVYQFNPLHSSLPENISCSPNAACAAQFGPACQCNYPSVDGCVKNAQGNYECLSYAYSNDASLLLPTHLLGSSYVVVSQDHESNYNGASNIPLPGIMAVIATQNNTSVQIQFAGHAMSTAVSASYSGPPEKLCAGPPHGTYGNLPDQPAGSSQTYVINAGDVLHFWTANAGTGGPTCAANGQGTQSCLWPNDFTGSVVTSVPNSNGVIQPIAVFGGADCTFKPYNWYACDHIEEEMFPFNTWGTDYVGTKSKMYQGATSSYPDYWRIVSACGPHSCPNGATITITPPIAAEDKGGTPIAPQYCTTSGSTTTCTLPPLQTGKTAPWFEFEHASSFSVHSSAGPGLDTSAPITLAGYHVGENFAACNTQTPSTCGCTTCNPIPVVEGDPDLMLMPPVQQWRKTYNFLAPTTYKDNYANLMIVGESPNSCANCGNVQLDGVGVPYPGNWANIPGTNYFTNAITLPATNGGGHLINSTENVGVLVYGYDQFVSYGYTGGLNLQPIVGFAIGG